MKKHLGGLGCRSRGLIYAEHAQLVIVADESQDHEVDTPVAAIEVVAVTDA